MKKTFIVLLFGALMFNSLKAQEVNTDPIVMEIGDEKITQSEFLKNFRQANSVGDNATAAQKRKALDEYVDLFVNFRLKIKEALAERYDTVPSFVEEYSTYRNELAAPYLIDSKLLEEILQEVYRRNQQAVRASHIMVALPRNPSPEDTLKDMFSKILSPVDSGYAKLTFRNSILPFIRPCSTASEESTMRGLL